MQKVRDCVRLVEDFITAACDGDWDKAAEVQAAIAGLENEADSMKDDLRANLPQSLLMPVARADVLALLSMQDKLANRGKDVAGLMLGRRMEVPEAIVEDFKRLIRLSVESAAASCDAIEELDTLFESGFSRRESAKVNELIGKIDSLEGDADACQIVLRRKLMEIENDYPPVSVMFLYQAIDEIGRISDVAHSVANRLKILLAK